MNRITGIVKDRDGNVWISAHGIWKYDWQQEQFKNYPGYALSSPVNGLHLTSDLNYDSLNYGLWFNNGGAFGFFDIKSSQFYDTFNNPKNWKIFSMSLDAHLSLDNRNRLWFFNNSSKKLCYFDVQENKITETSLKVKATRKIKADNENRVWISFWNGFSAIYDVNRKIADSSLFVHQHPYSAITDHFIDFYVDKDSNYWIGSAKGLSILRPERQFYQVFSMNEDLLFKGELNFSITAIAEKNNNELFVGTTSGIYLYNLSDRKFKKLAVPAINGYIHALYYSKQNNVLWTASDSVVYLYDANANRIIKNIPVNYFPVFIVRDDLRQQVWVGTWYSGLFRLSDKGEILTNYVKDRNDSSNIKTNNLIAGNFIHNEIWFGFNGSKGFATYDYDKAAFKYYNPDNTELPDQGIKRTGPINTIASDKKGNLWIGTFGNGIFYWDRDRETYKQWLQTDGLSSNFVNNIITDENDNLWICDAGGIDFFLKRAQKFIPLNIDFSFTSSDYHNSVLAGRDGKLFFFNSNTIIRVDPSQYRISSNKSPLVISGFRIFGEEIPFEKFTKNVNLTYKQNFFTFEFSSLRTNPIARVQYAYKLEGFDKDWNYSGNRNFASYTNVPGGHYIFKLKATNESGEWGAEQLLIPVMITPPFWKTAGFIILVLVIVIALVYMVFQNRIRQLKKVYLLRSKISQDLHDEVGATLSGIALYSHLTGEQIKQNQTEQVEKSLEVIQKSATQMVNKLNDIVWAVNPSHDSTGDLLQRLEEYALETATARKIEVKSEIDERIRQLILPMEHRKNIYLVCKESVNNAIKYAGCSRIKLSAIWYDHHMEFIVEDDGAGFDPEKIARGNGLNNMQQRAGEINGQLTIDSLKGKGTRVRLFCKIPQ